MQSEELAREYQSKTNEELLRLAKKLDRLGPEASAYLMNEFAKRGLHIGETPGPVVMPAIILGKDSSTAGSSQTVASVSGVTPRSPKAPWRPQAAGWIAFWFGPVAGAMVVAASLRRMGHQERARKVILLALGVATIEAVILFFVSSGMDRMVGFAGEIAFLLFFPPLMEKEFKEWKASHPDKAPADGLSAIGWAMVGAIIFGAITAAASLILSGMFPSRH